MLKRIIAAMLAIFMLFAVAACGKTEQGKETPTDAVSSAMPEPDKKIAILVAPESQYPEDYMAAKELAAANPDKIIIKEYADSRILVPGDSEIITLSREIAADPAYGAIIYARATRFTSWAITQAKEAAKEVNPTLKTICIEPEESVNDIAKKADLVLTVDWMAAANDIVAQAKEHGAEYFLMFSFNRHITENALLGGAKVYLQKACEENGITFVYENTKDASGNESDAAAARKNLRESVARLGSNGKISGRDVAVFSTDSLVQDTLVGFAAEKGFIYISPSFPTAYNGIADKLEIAIPEDYKNVKEYIANTKAALTKDPYAQGRYSIYNYTLAATMLSGALKCAVGMVNGEITGDNLSEKVTAYLTESAANEKFTVSHYDPANPINIFKVYCPGFEKIK